MRIFEIVKENVNLREAAELYGIDVNRYSKALCPFHNDRHPSLYVADDHYYCFACGEHGDVIDFVGRLFQLSPYDAVRKLMADFHLSPDKPPSVAALHTKRIRTEAQQLRENERLCFSVLSDYSPCAGKSGRAAIRGHHAREAFSYYAAQCQAGSVSSAWRGRRRVAGATTHYAQKSRAVSKFSQ